MDQQRFLPIISLLLCTSLPFVVCLTLVYSMLQTRTEVRVQGIITSLVFDHALRIRLKAEISDKERSSMTNPITSDTPSSSGGGNEMEDSTTAHLLDISTSTSTTAVVSQEVDHTKAATFEVKKEDAESEAKAAGDNLVGKLNNLVTSDLNNISKGCDFLLVGTHRGSSFLSPRYLANDHVSRICPATDRSCNVVPAPRTWMEVRTTIYLLSHV